MCTGKAQLGDLCSYSYKTRGFTLPPDPIPAPPQIESFVDFKKSKLQSLITSFHPYLTPAHHNDP